MSNLSWDEEEEEEDAEEEEPAEESPKKPPKGQVDKKGNAAKVSTPLAGDAVCGEGSPCHGGGVQPPFLGASHTLIPTDGLLCTPTKPLSVKGVSRNLHPLGREEESQAL